MSSTERTIEELTPHARRLFEADYQAGLTRRPRCSREDFLAGWLALAQRLGVTALFVPEVPPCPS